VINPTILKQYSKTIAAAGTALGVIAASVADGAVTSTETFAILAALVGIGSVFAARNTPPV
jgi:hypothetical protein